MQGSTRPLWFMVALLATLGGTGLAQSDSVRVRSAEWLPDGLVERLRSSFAKASPDLRLEWQSAGTGSVLTGLFDGSADIAISARSANVREREMARRLGVDLREFVITLDAVTVIVHPSNALPSLSIGQLQTLYSSRVVRWMGVGGSDETVRLLAPSRASGVTSAFSELVFPGDEAIGASVEIVEPDEQLVGAVASDARAVGIISSSAVDERVRTVPIAIGDGADISLVAPSEQAVEQATYPLVYGLRAYTDGEPSVEVHRVLSFLMWREGRHQLEQAGFTPVSGFGAIKRETGTSERPMRPPVTRVGFGFRGARLDSQARDQLTDLAALAADNDRELWIIGHQEPEEGPPSGELALQRARSVADFLMQQGWSETRLTTDSAGLDEPLVPNDTLEGRRVNRRVDVWVLTSP